MNNIDADNTSTTVKLYARIPQANEAYLSKFTELRQAVAGGDREEMKKLFDECKKLEEKVRQEAADYRAYLLQKAYRRTKE